MQCPTCEQPVAVWAAFCPHCGAAQRPEETGTAPAATVDDAIDGDHTAPASLTTELFEPQGGVPGQETPAASPAERTTVLPVEEPVPAAYPAAVASSQPAYDPTYVETHEPRRGGPGIWVVALASAIVLAAMAFAAWSLFRVDDASNSPNAQTTTSPRPTTGASSAAPSPGVSSTSPSKSPSATATPSTSDGTPPAGSVSCGKVGTGVAAGVYAADQNTSCPFALEVQKAYQAAGSPGNAVTISATSPVTNKAYTLNCSGTSVVTCSADSGATVYLVQQG